jgi:AcrR family transcriptional regulator
MTLAARAGVLQYLAPMKRDGPVGSPSRSGPETQLGVGAETGEGLRERKKKLTRQLISDTATAMFLRDGFDAVRVIDVAAACGVAEKTVYNYFPNKESLILDRFEDMEADVRRVFDSEGASWSPVEAAVDAIVAELVSMFDRWGGSDNQPGPPLIRRFAELMQQTPALRAAQWEMLDRMSQVAAQGIALRAGVDPGDPEPQIAANAILGLWRIQFESMIRHAASGRTSLEVRDAVIADVRRAADLLSTGLSRLAQAGPGPSGGSRVVSTRK